MHSALGKLADRFRRYPARTVLAWLMYHAVTRGLWLDVHEILLADEPLSLDARIRDVHNTFDFHWVTAEDFLRLAQDPAYDLPEYFIQRLTGAHDRCLGVYREGRLVSYTWYATRCIEADHAPGGDLSFPPDMVYMYKAFTLPAFRGQNLYSAGLFAARQKLAQEGIRTFLTAVEWRNLASLSGCARAGFRRVGRTVEWRLSRPAWPLYHSQALERLGLRFGKSADLSPRRAIAVA